MRHLIIIGITLLSGWFVGTPEVLAQEDDGPPIPNISTEGLDVTFSPPVEQGGFIYVNYISDYFTALFQYLIGFSIVAAIALIMVGGVQYMLRGAIPSQAKKAKERMQNATVGLVLMLSVYAILYTVNPELTILEPVNLKVIQEIPYDGDAQETSVNPDEAKLAETMERAEAETIPKETAEGLADVPLIKQTCGCNGTFGCKKYGPEDMDTCSGSNDDSPSEATCCTTYGFAGCAPTNAAMILKHKGLNVDTTDVGDLAVEIGARRCNKGTTQKILTAIVEEYDSIEGKYIQDPETARTLLENKFPLIGTTPSYGGCWRNGGHWIIFTGLYESEFDGEVKVGINDSAYGRTCFPANQSKDLEGNTLTSDAREQRTSGCEAHGMLENRYGMEGDPPALGVTGIPLDAFAKVPVMYLFYTQDETEQLSDLGVL